MEDHIHAAILVGPTTHLKHSNWIILKDYINNKVTKMLELYQFYKPLIIQFEKIRVEYALPYTESIQTQIENIESMNKDLQKFYIEKLS